MAIVENQACPVTGQMAKIEEGTFDGWQVDGPFTAGGYQLEFLLIEVVRNLSPAEKAKLKTWIVDQHRAGVDFPPITEAVLDSLPRRRPLTYEQRVTRFFQMLRDKNVGLGTVLRFFPNAGFGDDQQMRALRGTAMAWLGFWDEPELSQMLVALCEEELIRDEVGMVSVAPEGLRRLDKLNQVHEGTDQVFVAMWFSGEMEEAYARGFEEAIEDKGYKPLRIDRKEHANKIDDEIIAEIRRSRFVVADFTCELVKDGEVTKPLARGGVYYEAGFAQGLGIPVIWCSRADCLDHVHFDTRQYAHIVWEDAVDLRVKLGNRIGALFGDFGGS